MKKHLLFFLATFLCTSVFAQTYFSKTVGDNVVGAGWSGTNSGFGSVRLETGSFVSVAVNDAKGFEVKTYDAGLSLLNTVQMSHPAFQLTNVYTVQELSPNVLLVTGMGLNGIGSTVHYVATLNLTTNDVKVVQKLSTFAYTSGPKAEIESDGIFVIFPEYGATIVHGFDLTLNPTWCDSIGVDTLGKNPGMDIECTDTEIVVTCKNDSAFGGGSLSRTGNMNDYFVYHIPGYTRMYGVEATVDGNFINAGLHMDFMGGGYRPAIIKRMGNGTPIWAKELLVSMTGVQRFVDAVELPDGRIMALGTTVESYSNTYFDVVCIFTPDGNLERTVEIGNVAFDYMLYDVKVYADGVLLSGVRYNTSTTENENFMAFTDFDFADLCHQTEHTYTTIDINITAVVHPSGSIATAPSDLATSFTFPDLVSASGTNPEECTLVTSTNPSSQVNMTVSPNPVTSGDVLKLNMTAAGDYTVQIADMTGKVVSAQNISGTSASISTSGLTAGMYLVNVRSASAVSSHKLIVR